jgi:hypothetical protein
MADKSISGIDYLREGEPEVIVKVFITYDGTDRHAFNKQVPNVGLSLTDKGAGLTKKNVTLLYGDARKLGEFLIALADEADAWNHKIERNT